MNYIIVPTLKLVLRTDADDIEDYEKEMLDEIIDESNIDTESADVGDTEVGELSIKECYELYRYYKLVQSISGIEVDKLLLYWLRSKEIDYQIEEDIDEKEYTNEGYSIIPLDIEEEKD